MNPHARKHAMSPIRTIALSLLPIVALSWSCAPAVTCGDNTVLNKATNECIVAPDFNIIVADFDLGEFALTNVDVPEQLAVGSPDTRSFNITNNGASDREIVTIRFGVVPVAERIEELREVLAEADEDTILDETTIGQAVIENLKKGETRTVEYTVSAPVSLKEGLYGLFFAVDEVPLKKAADGTFIVDQAAPSMQDAEGKSRYSKAALIKAPSTIIIGKPDRPNLRILYTKLDNSAFELDRSERTDEPLFNLSARMSSQGLSLTQPFSAQLELELPGHVIDVKGKDQGLIAFPSQEAFDAAPATTTYRYDASRKFPLLVRKGTDFLKRTEYESQCQKTIIPPATDDGEPTEGETCAVIFNDQGRDDLFELYLDRDAIRLLERTRALPGTLNPGLNAMGELTGTLVLRVDTSAPEYRDNKADNVTRLPVVFMAPTPAAAATENDRDNGGTPGSMSWGQAGPYGQELRNTNESRGVGGEWFGAGYTFDNRSSVNRVSDATVGSHGRGANDMRINVLKQEQKLFEASGESDWGADKPFTAWKASARVSVLGTNFINASFEPSLCTTENNVTACNVFEVGSFERDRDRKGNPRPKAPPKKRSRQTSKEWQKQFMAGPVPLMVRAEVGISAGMKIGAQFIMDRTRAVTRYGGAVYLGPGLELGATAFGGVSIGLARAGVEGSLTIMSAELLPTLTFVTGTQRDAQRNCLMASDTELAFTGPLTVKGPSGRIGIVAYVGVRICIFRCWRAEKKVFDLTLASFSSVQTTRDLWEVRPSWVKQRGEAGMCADAFDSDFASWRSPTSCANGYCANSSTNGQWSSKLACAVANPNTCPSNNRQGVDSRPRPTPDNVLASYKYVYNNPSARCVDVEVRGVVRWWADRVYIYDANKVPLNDTGVTNGREVWNEGGWSGDLRNGPKLRVCSLPVTVTLESAADVSGMQGVTVNFTRVD